MKFRLFVSLFAILTAPLWAKPYWIWTPGVAEKGERVTLKEVGPFSDVARLNAAAGLVVDGKAKALADAMKLAQKSVDSGEALKRLDRLVDVSNKA